MRIAAPVVQSLERLLKPTYMPEAKPTSELMISLNYLFPKALESGDTGDFTGRVAARLQKVVSEELGRLGLEHVWDSTHFLHLGTKLIPDSRRCTECGAWLIPEENSHPTSVVASGWQVEGGRFLCEHCWSLFDGEKIPITS